MTNAKGASHCRGGPLRCAPPPYRRRCMRPSILALSLVLTALAAPSCGKKDQREAAVPVPAAEAPPPVADPASPAPGVDPFTYANYREVRVTDLALDVDVLFNEKAIDGTAILSFERLDDGATDLVLDANDLDIKSVEAGDRFDVEIV